MSERKENSLVRATTVHLVRHGDVENPDKVYYGRLPGFPLSEEGRRQAQAAGAHLSERTISAVYASPQLRAQQTARIVRDELGLSGDIQTEPLLNEVKSQYDGAAHSEMEQRAWNFYSEAAQGFEQPADVLARMRRFLERARREYEGREIVAVSHADPIVFVWMWVLGIPLKAENRRLLEDYGLSDDYPARASVSTFRFETPDADERPDYSYVRPYSSR